MLELTTVYEYHYIVFLFLFWLFLEKFISFPYWIQNKLIIFLINEMSDTEDSSEWYIKRLGVRFFKLAQMFFIKSSQNFSISFILSIGVRKFFIYFNIFEVRTSWSLESAIRWKYVQLDWSLFSLDHAFGSWKLKTT